MNELRLAEFLIDAGYGEEDAISAEVAYQKEGLKSAYETFNWTKHCYDEDLDYVGELHDNILFWERNILGIHLSTMKIIKR